MADLKRVYLSTGQCPSARGIWGNQLCNFTRCWL